MCFGGNFLTLYTCNFLKGPRWVWEHCPTTTQPTREVSLVYVSDVYSDQQKGILVLIWVAGSAINTNTNSYSFQGKSDEEEQCKRDMGVWQKRPWVVSTWTVCRASVTCLQKGTDGVATLLSYLLGPTLCGTAPRLHCRIMSNPSNCRDALSRGFS